MAFKVVNVFGPPGFLFTEGQALASKQGCETVLTFCRTEEEIATAARDADVLIGAFTGGVQSLSAGALDRMPKLKLIAGIGIGYEGIDLEAASTRGICVANVPDYCLEEMADHTMLLLLALAKKLLPTVDAVHAGRWDTRGLHSIRAKVLPPIYRLSGRTLGLVGFGNIPRTVTPRAIAFGIKVIAYDPYVKPDAMRKCGVEPANLETVLRESDFVSLHPPLTEQTRHMIGLEQFKKMKRTAFFINTARGALVKESDLHTALTEGLIAGAAVDVMDPEPPLAENPLMIIPNMIITPHIGQYSEEAENNLRRMPYEEAVRVKNGGWPRDVAFRNPTVKDRYRAKWSNTEKS